MYYSSNCIKSHYKQIAAGSKNLCIFFKVTERESSFQGLNEHKPDQLKWALGGGEQIIKTIKHGHLNDFKIVLNNNINDSGDKKQL